MTGPEITRIAAEAGRHTQTVSVVLHGGGNEQSRAAVFAAMRRLGLEVPRSARAEATPVKPR